MHVFGEQRYFPRERQSASQNAPQVSVSRHSDRNTLDDNGTNKNSSLMVAEGPRRKHPRASEIYTARFSGIAEPEI